MSNERSESHSESERGGDLVITISGKSGCGNSTVSRMVAERQSVDHDLDRRLMELAADGGCVLGTRLAIWLIEDRDLSVYLDATQQTRAARIASREVMSYGAALTATDQRDRRDRNRYLRLYDIDIDDASQADLVVDTEELDEHAVVGKIIEALRARNLLD